MYFDLHNHPALKSFLTDTRPDKRDDCWTVYRNFLDFLVGNIIDSQASLRQLDRSRTRLVVAALYVLEEGLEDISLIRNILPVITHLDRGMIRSVEPARYWSRFREKVEHLEASLDRGGAPERDFVIASTAAQIDPARNTLVLSVEGAHILQDTPDDDPLRRLDELKSFRHRIFYLTVCHFIRNPFCTQAFAMKLVNVRKKPVFLPGGTGLSALGRQLVERAYDETTGRRILIDVKHFSLSGRRDFYAWKRADPRWRDIPIIASHVGVTGHSWDYSARSTHFRRGFPERLSSLGQYLVRYDAVPGLRLGKVETRFNPQSINLYDEDIREVIASGGLIGLMLDQRLLGVGSKFEEYFGSEDFEDLRSADTGPQPAETIPAVALSPMEEEREIKRVRSHGREELFNFVNPLSAGSFRSLVDMLMRRREAVTLDAPRRLNRRQRTHLLHLANNLLHIVRVGGPTAWRHVCLGTDFDGLVDAPNNCESVLELPDLEVHLREIIEEYLASDDALSPADYHITDLDAQIRDVMENNGRRFVMKNL